MCQRKPYTFVLTNLFYLVNESYSLVFSHFLFKVTNLLSSGIAQSKSLILFEFSIFFQKFSAIPNDNIFLSIQNCSISLIRAMTSVLFIFYYYAPLASVRHWPRLSQQSYTFSRVQRRITESKYRFRQRQYTK